MALSLYKTGSFTIDGEEGTLAQLNGRFSFINQNRVKLLRARLTRWRALALSLYLHEDYFIIQRAIRAEPHLPFTMRLNRRGIT